MPIEHSEHARNVTCARGRHPCIPKLIDCFMTSESEFCLVTELGKGGNPACPHPACPPPKARHGKARQGMARQGKARQGTARHGTARHGLQHSQP